MASRVATSDDIKHAFASNLESLPFVQNVGQRPDLALQFRLFFVQFISDFLLHRKQIGQMVGVRHVKECGEQFQPVVLLEISAMELIWGCYLLVSQRNTLHIDALTLAVYFSTPTVRSVSPAACTRPAASREWCPQCRRCPSGRTTVVPPASRCT